MTRHRLGERHQSDDATGTATSCLVVANEAQAIRANGLVVRAPRDERDIVSRLKETSTDDTADRPRPVDDKPHGYEPAGRLSIH